VVNLFTTSPAEIDYAFFWATVGPKRLYPPCEGKKKEKAKRIRNHAHMSKEDKQLFLTPFFETARRGGILMVNETDRYAQLWSIRNIPMKPNGSFCL
jgi:hypothetical protein